MPKIWGVDPFQFQLLQLILLFCADTNSYSILKTFHTDKVILIKLVCPNIGMRLCREYTHTHTKYNPRTVHRNAPTLTYFIPVFHYTNQIGHQNYIVTLIHYLPCCQLWLLFTLRENNIASFQIESINLIFQTKKIS